MLIVCVALSQEASPNSTVLEARLMDAGRERAARFARCASRYHKLSHHTDTTVTLKDRMMFVDNVKAGSSTLRGRIKQGFGTTWTDWDSALKPRKRQCKRGARTTTGCVSAEEAAELFVWSSVRDPVSKFESGVRQMWERKGRNRDRSADELLRRQLSLAPGKWIDERDSRVANSHRVITKPRCSGTRSPTRGGSRAGFFAGRSSVWIS